VYAAHPLRRGKRGLKRSTRKSAAEKLVGRAALTRKPHIRKLAAGKLGASIHEGIAISGRMKEKAGGRSRETQSKKQEAVRLATRRKRKEEKKVS